MLRVLSVCKRCRVEIEVPLPIIGPPGGDRGKYKSWEEYFRDPARTISSAAEAADASELCPSCQQQLDDHLSSLETDTDAVIAALDKGAREWDTRSHDTMQQLASRKKDTKSRFMAGENIETLPNVLEFEDVTITLRLPKVYNPSTVERTAAQTADTPVAPTAIVDQATASSRRWWPFGGKGK